MALVLKIHVHILHTNMFSLNGSRLSLVFRSQKRKATTICTLLKAHLQNTTSSSETCKEWMLQATASLLSALNQKQAWSLVEPPAGKKASFEGAKTVVCWLFIALSPP